VERLCMHIGAEEALPVRLTAAYTLLSCRKAAGLETLLQFLDAREEEEARKAAVYMFATELPFQITEAQREQLSLCLLQLLRDTNPDIAMHAAHALSKIAWPTLMMPLSQMLGEKEVPVQVAVLICMEEIARRDSMRDELQQSGLPTRILPLLRSETVEVRRQASYTLAACGGEYALAALGTILLRQDHPGRLEAIESLRLVRGALRPPTRIKILRWLLQLLNSTEEITQVTALDSLAYLLWQASTRGRKRSWYELGDELLSDGTITELLYHASAWVRQRAVELFRLLGQRVAEHPEVYQRLQQLLQYDEDSGVRASVAYTFGQLGTRQAVAALLRALIDVDRHVALTALNALEATSTPDDTIIVFALKELTRYGLKGDQDGEQLIQKAEEILKKWRRSLARAGKRKQEG
ncbi:MAG: HEAT repeat domain-containing protein, partial [Ktedonobacteraceae bacterium]|nr:HEAT repeat domain-containing protein [Ktedonobacteraceae bacterium]